MMRVRTLGLLLLAWGCGGTENAPRAGTTGGQGTAGGGGSSSGTGAGGAGANAAGAASGGSSGSAGSPATSNPIGVPLGDTPTEACIAYAWAVCSRREECRGTPSEGGIVNCTTSTLDCPDLSFSPGATRTPEILKECATTFTSLPCDQVRLDKLPSCVTPGTRTRGEKCVFASQCSSLNCATAETCGVCGARAAKGESCAEFGVDCEVGTTCNTETQLCEAPPPYVDTRPGLNEPCAAQTGCKADTYCKADAAGSGVCVVPAKTNESCADTLCEPVNYCAAADSICKPNPSPGLPCGLDKSGALRCDGRGYCDAPLGATSGTCKPVPKAGEPCYVPPENPTAASCRSVGLHCDTSVSPPVCRGPGKAGSQCYSNNDCLGLSVCACDESLSGDCSQKRCIELKVAGQPCTAPSTTCHPGFECVSGACQAITLRGDFTKACGAP